MSQRYIGGALLAVAAILAGPSAGSAQFSPGEDGGFQAPIGGAPITPLPTGQPGQAGFYIAPEFVLLTQTRAIGNQQIAVRGFYDSTGILTGAPGTLIGTGHPALATDAASLGRTAYQPGFQITGGYRFDDGTTIFASYLQVYDAHYSSGATLVPPGLRINSNLADTFISAPVFGFTPLFAGPATKTLLDGVNGFPTGLAYGIWNGATTMDEKFTQRYQQAEIGMRTPLFQTDYSRVYGIAGGRFAWFFERFQWSAVSYDVTGVSTPQSAADYTNTLSQRMYGPMVGIGHEIFIANQFSLTVDLTGAALLDVAKERAKYELRDQSTESKWGNETFTIVPNFNGSLNLWWYPIEGVQVRFGYTAMTYFNTKFMQDPVGFNFDQISPAYDTKWFRIVHGINAGIGFFF